MLRLVLGVACCLLLSQNVLAGLSGQLMDHNTEISGLRREDIADGVHSVLQAATRHFGYDMPSIDKIREVRQKIADSKKIPQHQNWVKSGNVANYNGLKVEPYLHVPIVLNLVFIGFEGDGHHALKLTEKQLKPWFQHMEHMIPHNKVRLHGANPGPGEDTNLYYQYHYRVVELDPDVNTVLEAVIWDNARPENPWAEDTSSPDAQQFFVDVTAMTDVLDTVTESLNLDEHYTLFIMNPKLPHHGFKYGYRYGFSEAELVRLRENMPLVMELQKRPPSRPSPQFPDVFLAEDDAHHNNASKRFTYKALRNESRDWAEIYMAAMHDVSYWQRHPAEEAWGKDASEGKEKEAPSPPRDMLFEVAATKLLQSAHQVDRDYIRSVLHEPFATANCIVDSYVADKRYAFIDLSAGPFEWGPIVGGEGVRTSRSLPSIGDISVAVRDFTAGGKWNDTSYVHRLEKQLRRHGPEILKKEQDVLLVFLEQHCSGQQNSEDEVATCKALRHKLSAVETYLRKHEGEDKSDPKVIEHLTLLAGGPHEGASEYLVLQSLFAKLGNIIHTTQRHLITPTLAESHAPYAAQVKFHVYIVRNHNDYKPDDKENFDFDEFKRQINEFALPRQRFTFTLSRHTLAEDHGLAMAYARSLRSAVVGTLRVDGRFVSTKRLYLDSLALHDHMKLLQPHFREADGEADGEHAHAHTIPIFLFSLDFPLPVFIDKFAQARSMSDMVLGIQSDDTAWHSHLACNGKPVVWNLRNPTRALLSATLQHLAGLLPMHTTLNEAHRRVGQDWLWSVGCSPLAQLTSTPGNFSQFHIDTAQRNYVLESLSQSLHKTNEAVAALATAQTGSGSEKVFGVIPNDRIVQLHVAIKQAWRKALVSIRLLDFTGAIPIVHAANRNAGHLMELADQVNLFLKIDSCTRVDAAHPNSRFDWSLWLVIALAAVSAGFYLTYRPRIHKPKLI